MDFGRSKISATDYSSQDEHIIDDLSGGLRVVCLCFMRTIGILKPTFFPRLLQSVLTHLAQKGRSMDHKVEKGLNDQLGDFLELFRVHSSYYWLLPLWLTKYSMQDSFSMARSAGSYLLPPGGDLSASFMCAIICVNI
jgi:hypothetical protein